MSSGGKVKDMGNNTCSEADNLLGATKQKELKQSTTLTSEFFFTHLASSYWVISMNTGLLQGLWEMQR